MRANENGIFPFEKAFGERGYNPGGANGPQVINGYEITIQGVNPDTPEYVLLYKGHIISSGKGGGLRGAVCVASGHEEKECMALLSYEELYALHFADMIA